MARGFTYALYTGDNGQKYAKQVDRDQASDPTRGWDTLTDPTGFQGWPVRAQPRRVLGVSPTTGRRNSTIVASTTADLWTGVATQFFCETNDPDSAFDTFVVTRRRGESFPAPHASAPFP